MQERSYGALVGIATVALTYGLARLPFGWAVAAAILGLAGWIAGGYIRSLRRMSLRDELTGIYNRRPFERALTREWDRAVRYGRPLSLLFLDVDDFGLLNKRYGHLMGDEALKLITRQLRQNLRTTDILARWGGEEFVVLLPETDMSRAFLIAERIRSLVEQCQVRDRDCTVTVTVSTGVASFPGTARSAGDLLRQAVNGQTAAKVHKNAVEVVS